MEKEQTPIEVDHGMDMTIVTLVDEGILEEHQISRLKDAIEPVIEKNADQEMIINFAGVKFMSSSMLGLLVRIHKKVIELGGTLRLCNLDPSLLKVFEITQLNKVFNISDSI